MIAASAQKMKQARFRLSDVYMSGAAPKTNWSSEMPENPRFPRTQRIGIFVFEGFEPIDVWGFAEAFAIARFLGTPYGGPPDYPFEVILISRDGNKVKSINGPSVAPDWDFERASREPLDLLMIPGGGGTWPLLDETNHPQEVKALLEWV